jgi:hypothetical protein
MITPASGTVTLTQPFSVTITVTVDSDGSAVTDIPTVTANKSDPGVKIVTAPGTVTLSGAYTSVLPVTWHWIDSNLVQHTATSPPAPGSYKKITGVDSPTSLTVDVSYTITTPQTSDTYTETVTLGSYSTVADLLKTLLASTS